MCTVLVPSLPQVSPPHDFKRSEHLGTLGTLPPPPPGHITIPLPRTIPMAGPQSSTLLPKCSPLPSSKHVHQATSLPGLKPPNYFLLSIVLRTPSKLFTLIKGILHSPAQPPFTSSSPTMFQKHRPILYFSNMPSLSSSLSLCTRCLPGGKNSNTY